LTNKDLGLPEGVSAVLAFPKAGYVFEYVEASELLKAYWCDNNAVADSAMIEVAGSTNMSGVTGVKVLALGI
jgi:hypothetical protein